MTDKAKWEMIESHTYRMKVPGGWIYRYSTSGEAMVFVPDPPKNWESTY